MSIFKTINTSEKIVLFHGTTNHAINEIIKEGFCPSLSTIWNCSNNNNVYFYEFKKWCDVQCMELEEEGSYRSILQEANWQGQVQNAIAHKPDDITGVIEIRIPIKYANIVYNDDSTINMSDTGAVEVEVEEINKLLNHPETEVYIHIFPFSTKCSLLYLTGLVENEFACISELLYSFEYSALCCIAKQESYGGFFEDCICCDEDDWFTVKRVGEKLFS